MNPENTPITPSDPESLLGQINYIVDLINGGHTVSMVSNYTQEGSIKLNPNTQNLVVVQTQGADSVVVQKAFVQDNDDLSTLSKLLTYIQQAGDTYLGAEILTPCRMLFLSKEDIMNNLITSIEGVRAINTGININQNKLANALLHILVSEEVSAIEIDRLVKNVAAPENLALKYKVLCLLKHKAQMSKNYFDTNSGAFKIVQALVDDAAIQANLDSKEPADIFKAEQLRWRRDALNVYNNLGFIGPYIHLLAVDTYKQKALDMEPFNTLLRLVDEPSFTKEEFQQHLRNCTKDYTVGLSQDKRFQKLFQLITLLADAEIVSREQRLTEMKERLEKKVENEQAIEEFSIKRYGQIKQAIARIQNILRAIYDLRELSIQIGGYIPENAPIRNEFIQKLTVVTAQEEKTIKPEATAIYRALVSSYPENKVKVRGIYAGNKNELEIHAITDSNNNFSLQFDVAPSLTPLQKAFDNQINERISHAVALKSLERSVNVDGMRNLLRYGLLVDDAALSEQQVQQIVNTLIAALQLKEVRLELHDFTVRKHQILYLLALDALFETYELVNNTSLRGIERLYRGHIKKLLIGTLGEKKHASIHTTVLAEIVDACLHDRIKGHVEKIENSNVYRVLSQVYALRQKERELQNNIPLVSFSDFIIPVYTHQAEWADPVIASCYEKIVQYNQRIMDRVNSDLLELIGLKDAVETRQILNDLLVYILETKNPLTTFFQSLVASQYNLKVYSAVKQFFMDDKNGDKTLGEKITLPALPVNVMQSMYREAIFYNTDDPNYWIKYTTQQLNCPILGLDGENIFSSKYLVASRVTKPLLPYIKTVHIGDSPILFARHTPVANKNGANSLMRAIFSEEIDAFNGNKYKMAPSDTISKFDSFKNPTAYFLTKPTLFKSLHECPKDSLRQRISILDTDFIITNINGVFQDKAIDDTVYFVSTDYSGEIVNTIQTFVRYMIQPSDQDILFSFGNLHGDRGLNRVFTSLTDEQKKEGIKNLYLKASGSQGRDASSGSDEAEVIYIKDMFELILKELHHKTDWEGIQNEKPVRIRFHFASCLAGSASQHYHNAIGLADSILPDDSFLDEVSNDLMEVLARSEVYSDVFKNITFEISGAMGLNHSGSIFSGVHSEISHINSVTGRFNELVQASVKLEKGVITRQYNRIRNPNEKVIRSVSHTLGYQESLMAFSSPYKIHYSTSQPIAHRGIQMHLRPLR